MQSSNTPSTPLPFKKPSGYLDQLFLSVILDTSKFFAKAATLNLIVTRYLARAPDDVGPLIFTIYFPALTFLCVVAMAGEYAAREWVYYRMLEHGVLVQFEPRDELWSLRYSASVLCTLLGTVSLLLLIMVVKTKGVHVEVAHVEAVASHVPWSEVFNVIMQAGLMMNQLYTTRQITSRLVTINKLLQGTNKAQAIEWLDGLEIMDEATVQYHFLHITESIQQRQASLAASDASSTQGGTELVLDFAKVGRLGHSEATLKQLRAQRRNRHVVHQALSDIAVHSLWALSCNKYTTREDQRTMQSRKIALLLWAVVASSAIGAGATTTSDIFGLAMGRNATTAHCE